MPCEIAAAIIISCVRCMFKAHTDIILLLAATLSLAAAPLNRIS